jgi:proline iminopeptidase
MRARIRNTEIYFDVDGAALVPKQSRMQERPTAFLVHGGPGGDHAIYKSQYAALRESMQLVYFDHRGHGRSAPGRFKDYTLDENVEDMEALRLHLGLGPIVSVGTSYGGMVAMAHAARHPNAVSHLILVATAAHAGFIARSKEIVAERGTPEQIALCEDLWEGKLDTSEKMHLYFRIMGSLYSWNYNGALANASLERAIFSPEPLLRAYAPGGVMRAFDLRPELKAITAPTLILAGRHDWICPVEFSEEVHRQIQGSHLLIFERSSHSIGGDEPHLFLSTVADFVACGKVIDN